MRLRIDQADGLAAGLTSGLSSGLVTGFNVGTALPPGFVWHGRDRASRTSQVCGQPFPLIAGPGALASILILTSEARGEPTAFALVLVAAAIVLIVAYVFLRASARLARLLGQTGINVVTRVPGLLLAALAVSTSPTALSNSSCH